jgi:hypothetical protein
MTIDPGEHDRYKESITDPQSGEVVHRWDKALSRHQNRGCAKKKRSTE